MYKLSLPVHIVNPRFERHYESTVAMCKAAGVDRVFLVSYTWRATESEKQRAIELLNKYIPKFRAEGFEVGIWIDSLGHGGIIGEFISDNITDNLTRMVSLDGQTNLGTYCPLCENMQALAKDWIRRLARTNPDLIMLDDDYRYAFHGGDIYCACENHKKLLSEELGEPFDAERMKEALTTGGPNRWRDTWLRVQGKSLTDFAAMLRQALDEESPNIRMSACAVLSTWDIDGVDSLTLSRTFAGNTKPFLRLIGAPYWAGLHSNGNISLGTVCEYERLQQHWCSDSSVEIFCEGDSYPRPRYQVPAAYVEGFDQVMQAAGTSDGILKYMLDYVASPEFEPGYIENHIENLPLSRALAEAFAGKEAVGVTVFEPMNTLALSHNPGMPDQRGIPASLRFVNDTSLPVRYDSGDDATIIFGDAAELADNEQLKNGAVLDITAAEILTRRGFDVGLKCINGVFHPIYEEFIAEDELVGISGGDWCEVEISESAVIDSYLVHSVPDMPDVKRPASYTYENESGQRFAVYCFRAQTSFDNNAQNRSIFRSSCRSAQIRRLLTYVSNNALPAVCDGAPDLYILSKADETTLTVALWNFGVDRVSKPIVRLADDWSSIESIIGTAHLNGHVVTTAALPAFGCACFTLKK